VVVAEIRTPYLAIARPLLYHTPNPIKKNRGIVRSFRLELQKLLDAQSWVQLRAKTNLERCLRDL